jgi:hypothetical protein
MKDAATSPAAGSAILSPAAALRGLVGTPRGAGGECGDCCSSISNSTSERLDRFSLRNANAAAGVSDDVRNRQQE